MYVTFEMTIYILKYYYIIYSGDSIAIQFSSRVCLPDSVFPIGTCEREDELIKQIYGDALAETRENGMYSDLKISGQICTCDTDLCTVKVNETGQPGVNQGEGEVAVTTLSPE